MSTWVQPSRISYWQSMRVQSARPSGLTAYMTSASDISLARFRSPKGKWHVLSRGNERRANLSKAMQWLGVELNNPVQLQAVPQRASVSGSNHLAGGRWAAVKKIKKLLHQLIMGFLNGRLAPSHRVADPRSTYPQSLRHLIFRCHNSQGVWGHLRFIISLREAQVPWHT